MNLALLIKLKTKPEAAEQVLTTIHGLVSNRGEVTRLARASYAPAQPQRTAAPARDPFWETLSFILPAPLREARDTPWRHWHLPDPPPPLCAFTNTGTLCCVPRCLQTLGVFRCFLSTRSQGLRTCSFYWDSVKWSGFCFCTDTWEIVCGERATGKSLLSCYLSSPRQILLHLPEHPPEPSAVGNRTIPISSARPFLGKVFNYHMKNLSVRDC